MLLFLVRKVYDVPNNELKCFTKNKHFKIIYRKSTTLKVGHITRTRVSIPTCASHVHFFSAVK